MKDKTRKLIGWILLIVLLASALSGLVFHVVFNQKGSGIIIGGCGGVASENVQECCSTLAEENGIFTPTCVGGWKVSGGVCGWVCW